ncbi:hypothetical protein G4B88_017356 [Cannabis sativa]|uniref:Uncharacterized protein n=1 Tax=Cannabis sativa TaxID=3483 RepID=A0A7J6F6J0_CANSA|nr:hypothetical protein G4B88_017356 [Cannabis sativa]
MRRVVPKASVETTSERAGVSRRGTQTSLLLTSRLTPHHLMVVAHTTTRRHGNRTVGRNRTVKSEPYGRCGRRRAN